MLPLASGFFVGLRSINDTSNRFKASSDAQLLSIYLPPDVQSATAASETLTITCTGLVGTTRLQLVNAAGTFKVVYTLSTASPWKLTRYLCTSGTATQPIVVARNVKDSTVASSDVTLSPVSGSPLTQVAMKVTELATTTSPTNFVFTVTGQRRAT
jgi:hypothetical protein